MPPQKIVYARVERLWPESTIVCVATGPSLTAEDVEYCRGKAKVIAINDAYKLALWADVLYACDNKWWGWAHRNQEGMHPHFKECLAHQTGLKFGLKPYPGVQLLRHNGKHGLELEPGVIREGNNSGFQAIQIAVQLGGRRILLLGYDMQPGKVDKKGHRPRAHFFAENGGQHPDHTQPPYAACLTAFKTLVKPLMELGVEIWNCTPESALTCFPAGTLRQLLPATAGTYVDFGERSAVTLHGAARVERAS